MFIIRLTGCQKGGRSETNAGWGSLQGVEKLECLRIDARLIMWEGPNENREVRGQVLIVLFDSC